MILKYLEHLVAHVPAVLMPVIFLMSKAIVPLRKFCFSVDHFKGTAVGTFDGLTALVPCYVQPTWSMTVLTIPSNICLRRILYFIVCL